MKTPPGLLALGLPALLLAQTPPPVAAAKPNAAPDAGFVALFDGQTLAGWDGDPKYWRVEHGCIVGEITPETIVKRNTFLIWRGGAPGDFELKVEYRITAQGNSGINYRSVELTDAKWSLAGYQQDIDGSTRNKPPLRHTGQNYEERGRTFLARRGEAIRVDPGAKLTPVGSLGDPQELTRFIKNEDWNEAHIIARGSTLTHILNGHVMSVVIDDDAKNRQAAGLIGVQVHVGPPMKVEYRSFRLKTL
ncbi:MAG: DUF1080 domain-containing protein [Verrucomicrobia bacterium]|nr:DUF1080 domain-containing protein [Verrucomicrobiota bacterium]